MIDNIIMIVEEVIVTKKDHMIKIEIMVIENNTEKITDKMIEDKIIIENQNIKIHKTEKML